jgi:putative ABC transport system substrate-binding protein
MKLRGLSQRQDSFSANPKSKIANLKWLALSLIAFVTPVAGAAAQAQQQATKTARIGYLDSGTSAGSSELLDGFRKQMTQLNWIEGKNLTIEYRYAEGKGASRLAELTVDLVALKVDVIVVSGNSTALAAKNATSSMPVVMASSADPVGVGLVASLARPGGNITGLAGFGEDLAGKRLEILKEVIPKSTRFGVITATGGRAGELQLQVMKEAASVFRLKLIEVGSGSDNEKLVDAFRAASRERVNGIITISAPVIFAQRNSVAALAATYNLPAIYPEKEFVEAGGLMSYGVDRREQYQRTAVYVDKILRGTKPADLPIERPIKFEFWANLKAAKQINFTIPPNVLVRAEKVIR